MFRRTTFSLLFMGAFLFQSAAQSSFGLYHLLSAGDPSIKSNIRAKESFSSFTNEASPFETYFDEIPGTNLIGAYKLDGNALDSTGNNNGLFQGGVPATTLNRYGEAGKAMLFNGISNYMSTENVYNNPGPFSVSVWFKTKTNVGGALIGFSSNKTGNGGSRDRFIYMNSTGKLIAGVAPGRSKEYETTSSSYNDDKWHLVTMTVGAGGFVLYVDGEQTNISTRVKAAENYAGYWRIGHDDLDTWPSAPSRFFFEGALDDALIYHRQLSAEEVREIYYPVVNASVGNTCLGSNTGSITVSGSGGVPPYQYNINGGTYSGTNVFTNRAAGNYDIRVRDANNRVTLQTIKVGIQSLSQIPENRIIGFYKMNGNATDEFGNNHGTAVNAPVSSADRYGVPAKAYTFNGSNQQIYTVNEYSNPQEFTISIWFKTNTNTGGKLIGFGNSKTGLSTSYDRHLYMSNSGEIFFGIYTGSATVTVNTSANYNDNEWHHALATYSSAGMNLYVDGLLTGSTTQQVTQQNYKGYWRFGGDKLDGWPGKPNSNYFKGTLDDAAIYNRAVTIEEINTIYQSADGAGNNGPVCAGSSLHLSSTFLPGATYSWSGPAGFTSTQQNPGFLYTNASAGNYTVTVSSATGCVISARTIVGGLTNSGQWTGNVSSDWNNSSNWCDGLIPTSATDVTITNGVLNMPVINAAASVRNISIAPGATVTTQAAGTLNIAGLLTNQGIMDNSGTTVFNGSAQQTYSGVPAFNHVTINNPQGLKLMDSLIAANVTIQSGTLFANDEDITLTGNWINNAGAAAFAGGSAKVRMIGTSPQTIGGSAQTTFNILYASSVGSTITLFQNISVRQNMIVGGVLNLAEFTANGTTSAGILYMSTLGHLKIGGTNSLPLNYTTYTFLLGSIVEYSGTNQTISGHNYGTLILSSSSGSATKTAGSTQFSTQADFIMRKGSGTDVLFSNSANLNIGKNLLLEAGATLQAGSSIITVNGNWGNNGIFNGMTGKVILTGTSSSVQGTGGQNFNDLTISGNYVTFLNHSLTLTGNFETTGQGSFAQAAGGNLTMTGNGKTIKGAGISINNLNVSNSARVTIHPSLTISGNLKVENYLNTVAGSTITLSGYGKKITGAGALLFENLNITGSVISNSNLTIRSGLNVEGNFSSIVQQFFPMTTFEGNTSMSGKADLFDVTLTSGSKLRLASNSNLGISSILKIGTGATLDVTSFIPNTVTYNGVKSQSVRPITYFNLILSNTGRKAAQGNFTVNNDFEIKENTFFRNAFDYTHTIFRDWTNHGTFTTIGGYEDKEIGTIKFAGSGTSHISGSTFFHILTIDKTDPSATVILLNDIETTDLNMTNGTMETGFNKIDIKNTRTGSGIIWGNIQRTHNFSGGISYAFGGPENILSFVAPTGINTVTIHIEKGTPATFPSNASINRWYNIAIPNGSYTSATWRMEYDDNFLNGNNETTLEMWNNRLGPWVPGALKTGHDLSNNYVETNGLTDLTGNWTLSSTLAELDWTGAVDNNWNNVSNWQDGSNPSLRIPGLYDIAHIGRINFDKQPSISSGVVIKNLVFGSSKSGALTFTTGGSLSTGGISGRWTANAIHTINLGDQQLTVQGNVNLGDEVSGHAIQVIIGNGSANVSGWIALPATSKIEFTGNGVLKVGEKIVPTGGEFIAGNGTVEYNGTIKQDLAPLEYHHLVINKPAGLAELYEPTFIKGNLSLLSGTLENENHLVVKGDITIGENTILENLHIIEIAGNWLNKGMYDAIGINTIFNGTGTQTISASNFNNLEIKKPVGSLAVLTGDVTINGSLVGTSGTLDIKDYHFNRVVLGGSATMADEATLIIGGDNAPTLFGNYHMSPGSTIIFNGMGTQILQLPGLEYGNVIFRNSGLQQLTIPITVAGTLTIENGATLQGGSNTLTLSGNWQNAGTFVPESGTVVWKGTGKTINGATNFNKVIISGSYQVHSNLIFNDLLEITNSGAATSAAGVNYLMHGDLTVHGTLNIEGKGVLSGNKLQTMKLINATTYIHTVTFNGTVSPQLISTSVPQFRVLNVNNTGGVSPSVGWTVLSALNVGPGAFFHAGAYTHTLLGNMDNKGTISSTGNLNFMPPANVVLNFGTQFSSTGLVRLGGTGNITMAGMPASFNNLAIDNTDPAGISPSSNLTVTNDFVIKEKAKVNAGSHHYFIGGDVENYGMLHAQTSTFLLNGTGKQEIISSAAFHHVTLNKTSGQAIALTDITVVGTLDFITGKIETGIHTLFLSDNALVTNAAQTTGWVNGNLNKFISYSTADKQFEIGDGQYYTPVILDFTSITTPGGVAVNTTAGDHPQIRTSAINPERTINRYYTISSTGLAISAYDARFHYVPEDVDMGVTLAAVHSATYNGSSWTNDFPSAYQAPDYVKTTGLTWFGDMALGEICNPGTTISYLKPVFCTMEGMAPVIAGGTLGGVFSAEPGLSIDKISGEVNLGSSLPGEYVVTYLIAANSGCREFVSHTSIAIGIDGLWTGKISSDWNDPSNWSCSGVPAQDRNVTVPSGLINYPLISGVALLNNLTIQTGGSLIVTGTLQLFGKITNEGAIDMEHGTLEMSGTSVQVVSPAGFIKNRITELVINNTNLVTLDGPLDITGAVRSDLQGVSFQTNGHLTLTSSAAGSAKVGNMTGNSITGEVTVEHYLSAHKAWRLLSIPTNTTQSIKQSWQEGATNTLDDPKPGFGTQVMSNRSTWQAEGFDLFAGGGPSIKTWSHAANNWIGVTSAYNNIESNSGYLIIIRGDRKSNAFASPVTETILRTKGPLKMGDQPKIILPPYGYSIVGNPYAAPVDFRKVNKSAGVDNGFYAWDPYIRGNYNLGGYQTISEVNDWKPVPGGTNIYPAGIEAQNLQSGQAIFVHTTPVEAFVPHEYSIKFTENAKAGQPAIESRPINIARGQGGIAEKKLLRVTLYSVTSSGDVVADGNVAAFSAAYSNLVDGNDAIKILAGGENFGLKRDGKTLSIEARNEIVSNDTLHYYMTNVARKPYRLHFEPVNFYRANVQAYLLDNFLQTATPVSMFDTSGIDINITANAASAVPDRFKVIFRPMAPLAVTVTSVKALLNQKDVNVTWTVSEEKGIDTYEVEKSSDGKKFSQVHSIKANNNAGSRYSWTDESPESGDYYYRIRIVSQNGEVSYSEIVKVLVGRSVSKISVYPNPVVDGKIMIHFDAQPEGKYTLKLFNAIGQLMINRQVEHKGSSSSSVIQLPNKYAKGIYRLEIQTLRGEVQTIQVIN